MPKLPRPDSGAAHVCDPSTDPAGGPRTQLRVFTLMLAYLDHRTGSADELEFLGCPRCALFVVQAMTAFAAFYAAEQLGPGLAQRLEFGLADAEAELAARTTDLSTATTTFGGQNG